MIAELHGFRPREVGIRRASAAATCPRGLRLEWKKDQLMLDVVLKDVIVNQFDTLESGGDLRRARDPRLRAGEPGRHGPVTSAANNRTTVRRTLPPPASRIGVKLGRPTPVIDESDDAPHARASGTRRRAPARSPARSKTWWAPPCPSPRKANQPARRPGRAQPTRRSVARPRQQAHSSCRSAGVWHTQIRPPGFPGLAVRP